MLNADICKFSYFTEERITTQENSKLSYMKTSIGDRIRNRRKELKQRQEDVALALGINRVAISQWERDETQPNGTNLFRLARALSCPPEWILHGTGEPNDMKLDNAEMGPKLQGLVPLINNVQAGAWTGIKTMNIPIDQLKFVQAVSAVSIESYALRIEGYSMFNPSHSKSLSPGEIVVVDPNVQPINGSIVVALFDGEEEATIKMLEMDGKRQFLRPLNPDPVYKVLPVTENTKILAVAVDKIQSLR